MSQIEAVFQNGVFKPLLPIVLPENQRVTLQFEATEPPREPGWMENVKERKRRFVEQYGPLPDSTPDIAADRAR